MNAARTLITLVILALLGAGTYGGYWYLEHHATPAAADAAEDVPDVPPVAKVQVAPIQEGSIDVTATAFGTVEAALGATRTFSVPFESRVTRVLVVGGQQIKTNDPLVELEPSPDSLLRLSQARQQRQAAQNQLDMAKQRLTMKLATKQDVLAAEQALAAAELSLHSMESMGIDGKKTIRAAAQGVVSKVDVQQGQIVPAGAALVETIGQNQIVVRMGVESADAIRLHHGQAVRIEPVNGNGEAFDGTILRITRQVNPQTRLVNVYVQPAVGASLLLNEYVRCQIVIESRMGLVVPSQAVIPVGSEHVLFTVAGGHAVLRHVQVGPENKGKILVSGGDLRAGQQVVTVGNSQLTDKMAVDLGSRQ